MRWPNVIPIELAIIVIILADTVLLAFAIDSSIRTYIADNIGYLLERSITYFGSIFVYIISIVTTNIIYNNYVRIQSPLSVYAAVAHSYTITDFRSSSAPYSTIQSALESLSTGRIIFNPNKYMVAGTPEIVEARISKSLSVDLEEGLKGEGIPIIEKLQVGDVMKANLRGDAFDIEALATGAQVIPNDSYAHWTWKVTPIRSGALTLPRETGPFDAGIFS